MKTIKIFNNKEAEVHEMEESYDHSVYLGKYNGAAYIAVPEIPYDYQNAEPILVDKKEKTLLVSNFFVVKLEDGNENFQPVTIEEFVRITRVNVNINPETGEMKWHYKNLLI